jgi:hypothetical protein
MFQPLLGHHQVYCLCLGADVVFIMDPFLNMTVLYTYVTVKCVPIARTRLGKHIPAQKTRATIGLLLQGKGTVNTPP